MESAAADHFAGDRSEPTLEPIEPRTAGRCEVEMEAVALSRLEPALDPSRAAGNCLPAQLSIIANSVIQSASGIGSVGQSAGP